MNYVLDRKTDPTMSAWLSLARAIHDPDVLNALPNQMRITLENELRFVSQFLKRIRQPSQARSTTKKKAMHKSKGHTAMATKPVRRSFGGPLHYLEEREWRFVLRRKGNTVIPKGAIENRTYKENNGPRWYLPYSAGDDLFTIVFPDNQTMARAIGDKIIRRAISNNDRPHVTLLTIEDIGTF